MDKRCWFFGQMVTDSELDDSFDWVEAADRDLAVDAGLTGINAGLVVSEQAVPDLTVQVTAGTATSPTGERIAVATPATTVDCSVDRYGQATSVTGGAGFQKYLAIYARFARTATNPAVDDNGVTVYTRQYEAMEFLVEQGVEANPTATRPTLLTDAVHLADVLLVHAQTTITNTDLSVTRRGDWLREVLTERGTTAVYGTAAEACAALWQAIDSLAGDAGADDVGVADYTTANAAVTWATATVQDALEATADAIDGHVVGGAPNHPASAISTTVIAGAPESEAAPSTVQAVLANVIGHLNARTERAINERVTAHWDMFEDTTGVTSDALPRLRGEVLTGTLAGGSWPRDATLHDISRRIPGDRNLHSPMGEHNTIELGGVPIAGHTLIVRNSGLYTGRQRRLIAIVAHVAGAAGSGVGSVCYLVDPSDPSTLVAASAGLTGLPTGGGRAWKAMSVCSSGSNLFVQYYDAATDSWRIQGYDLSTDAMLKLVAWPATGVDPTPSYTGTPGAVGSRVRTYAMCIASTTRLAVLNGHIELTGAAGTALTVMNLSDGGSVAYGSGDVTTAANVITSGGLCSDGTNLYFSTVNHTTSVTTVSSAQVASPGAGRAAFVKHILGTASSNTENFCHCMVWTGETVVCPCENGTVQFIWTHGIPSGMIHYVSRAKPDYIKKFRWACYDGLNVWLFGSWDDGGLEVCGVAAVRMDAASEHVPSSVGGVEMVGTPIAMTTYDETLYQRIADPRNIGPAIWDGDAIWQVLSDGKAVDSGNHRGIFRAIRASSRR